GRHQCRRDDARFSGRNGGRCRRRAGDHEDHHLENQIIGCRKDGPWDLPSGRHGRRCPGVATCMSEHPDALKIRHNGASELCAKGKFLEAEKELRAVLEIRERVLGPFDSDTLESRNSLARALIAQAKYGEAEAQYWAVLNARERGLGPEHPDTLLSLYSLALCLIRQGKLADAREFAWRAMVGRRKVLGPAHPETLNSDHLYNWLSAKI